MAILGKHVPKIEEIRKKLVHAGIWAWQRRGIYRECRGLFFVLP
jgi:hypothetical protein